MRKEELKQWMQANRKTVAVISGAVILTGASVGVIACGDSKESVKPVAKTTTVSADAVEEKKEPPVIILYQDKLEVTVNEELNLQEKIVKSITSEADLKEVTVEMIDITRKDILVVADVKDGIEKNGVPAKTIKFTQEGSYSVNITAVDTEGEKTVMPMTFEVKAEEAKEEVKDETKEEEKKEAKKKEADKNTQKASNKDKKEPAVSQPDSKPASPAPSAPAPETPSKPAGSQKPAEPEKPAHVHNWVEETTTVSTPEEFYMTERQWIETSPAVPASSIHHCDCGASFSNSQALADHHASYLNVGDFTHPGSGWVEEIPGKDAEGYWKEPEKVVTKPASTETKGTGHYTCNCGATK